MSAITAQLVQDPALRQIVVLGGSPRAVAAALGLAAMGTAKRVTLIAGLAAVPTEAARQLARRGVDVVNDDPWLEIVPDATEGGGVVATESGRTFEFDALFQFAETALAEA